MKDFQDEQLFTELTPEQAAVIEGGKTLRLYSITCLKAGADPAGNDEAYLKLGDQKIWSSSMGTGDYLAINKSYGFEGAPNLSLYDDDASPNRDDLIDSVGVNGGTGFLSRQFEGSGSKYQVNYQVLT